MQQAEQEDVNRAVKAARRAFDEGPWRREEPKQRTRILNRLADVVEKNID